MIKSSIASICDLTRRPSGKSRGLRATIAAAAVVVAGVAGQPGTAKAANYTTRAAFNSAVKSGAYTESFDAQGDSDLLTQTKTYTSGAYSFTATTGAALPNDNDLFGADSSSLTDFLLSTTIPSNLTFTFPSGNVTAVGGEFSLLDTSFKVAPDTFQLVLADGTTVTRTSGTDTPFFGFTSATPITSLTFAVPADATSKFYYAAVNNFTVGAAVPEPASIGLAAVGGAVLLTRRRRVASSN